VQHAVFFVSSSLEALRERNNLRFRRPPVEKRLIAGVGGPQCARLTLDRGGTNQDRNNTAPGRAAFRPLEEARARLSAIALGNRLNLDGSVPYALLLVNVLP
jgi:hypothetical protein